jgi:hypothetical protein
VSWRTPVTLLVLLIVLLGAAFYGWQTIISPATEDDQTTTPHKKPKCDDVQQFTKGQLIRAHDIVVNVYNAGTRTGLATETLDDLSKRGFEAGAADNAPGTVSAANVTVLTAAKQPSPQEKLVAMQFKGDVKFTQGPTLDPGIDVIVGNDFDAVDKKADRSLRLKKDVSTCASVGKDDTDTAAG